MSTFVGLDRAGDSETAFPTPTPTPVTVIDAGVGNLGNVARALAHVGAAVTVTRDARQVAAARCLVLPGVGAFGPPREALRGPLEDALREALARGAWLLGICVGYQLLFEEGEEFGTTDGLGLLPGRITRLPADVPVPHIGWNRLHAMSGHPLLAGLADRLGRGVGIPAGPGPGVPVGTGVLSVGALVPPFGADPRVDSGSGPRVPSNAGSYMYFVHSFAPEQVPEDVCLARTLHGRDFAAVAGHGRILGTQFHPERSGEAGLRLLANFLEMAHAAAAGD
jgi:glutamine amidotransferase